MNWISVEDGLPEVFEGHALGCLVMYKRYEEQTTYYYGIGHCWKHGWDVDNAEVIVSHWMFLPDPPKNIN